jgi:RimJ/RimL family protein N-acetyltransferase
VTGRSTDEIRTDRLLLRRWRQEDREPFALLNADPAVMEHFPALLTREESDDLVDRIEAGFEEHGFGLWAVEAEGRFVGLAGLSVPGFEAPFLPAVEVGWRLARDAWGRGWATEAAGAALQAAFGPLHLPEVVAFTATTNRRSEQVMRRVGMRRVGGFDHPRLPEGHRLRRHVLYRADAEAWLRRPAGP